MAPLPAHGAAAGRLTFFINAWITEMGMESNFQSWLDSGFKALDNDNETRIPDAAFGATNPPAGTPKSRPSFTIEIGDTQSLPDLGYDAQWWLDPTKGGASVCITCKLDRTPRLVIDVWERQTTERGDEETKRSQHIIIAKSGKAPVTVRGGPLRISFRLVFGVSPTDPQKDLKIEDDRLKTAALTIWQEMGLSL
ncbi:uncharacterized protein N7503_009550 [Penicillium pulvis]|uniref:uncharacterized protein n=1 Tax=Penicillium pulvis TaxID=1562058 RepID=UPI0025479028|nr:uncharacterized protein N7503_009550 [Penicillium pulvis]KAJ5784338.1 hypothetical protein N7503_009550 [Penicillium pulvis]